MLIAFVGPNRSGKSTYLKTIRDEYPNLRCAHLIDPVRDLFYACGATPSRVVLFNMAEIICNQAGRKSALAEIAVYNGVEIIDGVRRVEEITFLRESGYTIVYIDTPEDILAQRKREAGEPHDLKAPLEVSVRDLKKMADIVLPGHGGYVWVPVEI